jgi:hypothetical protein
MNVVLAFVLIAPGGDVPKPKEQLKPVAAGSGVAAETEFHWPFFVMRSPDVQKELKLSKDQIAAFDGAEADLKKCVDELPLDPRPRKAQIATVTKWADETVAAILTREQQKRHRQIVWQVLECYNGPRALTANAEFAKEIGLTAEQLKRAKKIEEDFRADWHKLVQANPAVGTAAVPGGEELAKTSDGAALKLLTTEQKKKWNEALGEPFKGQVKQFPVPGLRPVPFNAPAEK